MKTFFGIFTNRLQLWWLRSIRVGESTQRVGTVQREAERVADAQGRRHTLSDFSHTAGGRGKRVNGGFDSGQRRLLLSVVATAYGPVINGCCSDVVSHTEKLNYVMMSAATLVSYPGPRHSQHSLSFTD